MYSVWYISEDDLQNYEEIFFFCASINKKVTNVYDLATIDTLV